MEFRELFAASVESKQIRNILDYDHLLLYWARVMGDTALADEFGGKWDHGRAERLRDDRTAALHHSPEI